MHDESVYAERALRAGARGYVMKKEAMDTVMTTASALAHDHGSPARRRCVRHALGTAIGQASGVFT